MKKVLVVIAVILVVAIIGLYFYVHNVHTYFSPESDVYYCKQDGVNTYVYFEGDMFYVVQADEYVTAFAKTGYKTVGEYWNRLFGGLYFQTHSLLSITNVPDGAKPATVIMICESCDIATYDDDNEKFVKYKNDDVIGTTINSAMFFYDDSMIFDGVLLNKVNGIDSVLAELVRLFIDNNDYTP